MQRPLRRSHLMIPADIDKVLEEAAAIPPDRICRAAIPSSTLQIVLTELSSVGAGRSRCLRFSEHQVLLETGSRVSAARRPSNRSLRPAVRGRVNQIRNTSSRPMSTSQSGGFCICKEFKGDKLRGGESAKCSPVAPRQESRSATR